MLRKPVTTHKKIFYLKWWEKALAEKFGKAEAAQLVARVQTNYDKLYTTRPAVKNAVLRFHLVNSILPGLALYRVLQEKGLSKHEALVEVDRIFTKSFAGSQRITAIQLPGIEPFKVFRKTIPLMMKTVFPKSGWELEWLKTDENKIAFNVHRCFYLDVLAANGARELTTIFCKFDDFMAAALPPSVRWDRTETLGHGHSACNFQWSNAK